MRNLLVFPALLAALVLSACGEDSGGSGEASGDLVSQPEPATPIEDQMEALNEALANDDCEQFMALAFTYVRVPTPEGEPPELGSPGTPEECKNTEQLRSDFAGVEFTEAEEYGTAAVSQGELPKPLYGFETAIALWTLDWDGEYRHVSIHTGDPLIGAEPAEGADPEPVIDGLLEAVRTGDCANADEVFLDGALFAAANADPTEQCEALVGGEVFAPAVKATEEPDVEQLGGTLDLIWYGVATDEAYFTVTLTTPGTEKHRSLSEEEQATFRVVDVLSNTEVELPPPPEPGAPGE